MGYFARLFLAVLCAWRVVAVAETPTPLPAQGKSRYGDPKYWEETYNASGPNSTYEWFLQSEAFVPLIRPYIALQDRILQVGCGNSRAAEVLAAAGYSDVTSVDISPSVIAASRAKYPPEAFPGLHFVVGDVMNMEAFGAGAFDVAVDKGTWDAIPKTRSRDMLRELRRVLRQGGLYLILTFSRPPNALDFLLDWRVGWKVEEFHVIPNPLDQSGAVQATIENFYLYVCRNENRDDDWAPDAMKVSPEVSAAIEKALEFQRVTRSFERDKSEL